VGFSDLNFIYLTENFRRRKIFQQVKIWRRSNWPRVLCDDATGWDVRCLQRVEEEGWKTEKRLNGSGCFGCRHGDGGGTGFKHSSTMHTNTPLIHV